MNKTTHILGLFRNFMLFFSYIHFMISFCQIHAIFFISTIRKWPEAGDEKSSEPKNNSRKKNKREFSLVLLRVLQIV